MDRRETRSARLKKYASVYKEYIRNKSKSPEPKKHRHTRESRKEIPKEGVPKEEKTKKPKETKKEKIKDSGRGRKKLTEYQKYVKEESKKEKYSSLKP